MQLDTAPIKGKFETYLEMKERQTAVEQEAPGTDAHSSIVPEPPCSPSSSSSAESYTETYSNIPSNEVMKSFVSSLSTHAKIEPLHLYCCYILVSEEDAPALRLWSFASRDYRRLSKSLLTKPRVLLHCPLSVVVKETGIRVAILSVLIALLQGDTFWMEYLRESVNADLKLSSLAIETKSASSEPVQSVIRLAIVGERSNEDTVSVSETATVKPFLLKSVDHSRTRSNRNEIEILSQSKMKVHLSNGESFICDRKCPHKGVDLSKGSIINGCVVCPKHQWQFDLRNNGRATNGKGILCCQPSW